MLREILAEEARQKERLGLSDGAEDKKKQKKQKKQKKGVAKGKKDEL